MVALAMMLTLMISAAAQDHGFPIPEGARKNASLSGATTLASGKNYTIVVYDVDAGIEAMVSFYEKQLRDARHESDAQEVRFAAEGGIVRLARLDRGTRITLVVGPR